MAETGGDHDPEPEPERWDRDGQDVGEGEESTFALAPGI
jgi:hypothetical protein